MVLALARAALKNAAINRAITVRFTMKNISITQL